jgi:hypothetical protein
MKIAMIGVVFITILFCEGVLFAAPVKGAGATSCGQWIEDRKKDDHLTQLNWVLGFISAYNTFLYKGKHPNGIFGSSDYNALAVWLDNYCSKNPLNTLYEGVVPLVQELRLRVAE